MGASTTAGAGDDRAASATPSEKDSRRIISPRALKYQEARLIVLALCSLEHNSYSGDGASSWNLSDLNSPSGDISFRMRGGGPASRVQGVCPLGTLDPPAHVSRPASAPVNRSHVTVSRFGGFGDSLLCTPALRELKRRNPKCHVLFYTNVTTLLQGLPYIDELRDSSTTPPDCIHLSYESFIPPQRHIAEILGDRMGVQVTDVRPDCVIDTELVNRFRHEWDNLPDQR